MEPSAPFQVEELASLSLLDALARQRYRLRIPGFVVCAALALALAALAGWFAVRFSHDYYTVAPYHYDSATYRMQAMRFYQLRDSAGLLLALREALQAKDSLDISLRLLLGPQWLLHRFGHLSILLPFMTVFIGLTMWYVYRRAGSLLLGTGVVAFLFAFPLIYGPYGAPYIGGIADYWKDNLATWLLGSAAVAWLLANNLERRGWAALSGLMLGLLVMQRAVAAIYAAPLFMPLFVWAAYKRFRQDAAPRAFVRVGVFVLPAALLGGLLVLIQWQQLYTYYFVVGYSYGNPLLVARYLANGLRYGGFFTIGLALFGVYLACTISIAAWPRQIGEILSAAWLVVALPLLIMLISAFYFGFYPLWTTLLIVLLAALIPRTLAAERRRLFGTVLLAVALFCAAIQYYVSSAQAQQLAERLAPTRVLYQSLVGMIGTESPRHEYALFFDEVDYPLMNQAFFDNGLLLSPSAVFVSIHDSYYRAAYGQQPIQQIIDANIHSLEQHPGMLAVAHCTPDDVLKQATFLSDGTQIAAPIAAAMGWHLLESAHWQALHRLDSPYGCLYVYQYLPQELSAAAKWQGLAFSTPITEIPLTLPVAPGVRLYEYTSRYSAEIASGNYYQWLPSGAAGLRLNLFSDQARKIVLRAHAVAGPARKDPSRTLVVSQPASDMPIQIKGEQDIAVELQLQPGLNQVVLSVKEQPDGSSAANGDTRELMLALIAPRLLPAGE